MRDRQLITFLQHSQIIRPAPLLSPINYWILLKDTYYAHVIFKMPFDKVNFFICSHALAHAPMFKHVGVLKIQNQDLYHTGLQAFGSEDHVQARERGPCWPYLSRYHGRTVYKRDREKIARERRRGNDGGTLKETNVCMCNG